ncbi:hypothetical protein L228DRAFT_11690 [Xylona heveae TC161]|uniref:Uncharacterized protein n=1 Tax=Xylona heveae (strain CBS 132557 / TC161) TaxID=1328760 RepID=A0A165JLM3_XYLHT|nr:hypothetical protein L228DRAFT_11690 [Xylona heveae TC161]KZF26395.1 hypothetical protein L228DRAFT_11690 [Xylona heveae TC161]
MQWQVVTVYDVVFTETLFLPPSKGKERCRTSRERKVDKATRCVQITRRRKWQLDGTGKCKMQDRSLLGTQPASLRGCVRKWFVSTANGGRCGGPPALPLQRISDPSSRLFSSVNYDLILTLGRGQDICRINLVKAMLVEHGSCRGKGEGKRGPSSAGTPVCFTIEPDAKQPREKRETKDVLWRSQGVETSWLMTLSRQMAMGVFKHSDSGSSFSLDR